MTTEHRVNATQATTTPHIYLQAHTGMTCTANIGTDTTESRRHAGTTDISALSA